LVQLRLELASGRPARKLASAETAFVATLASNQQEYYSWFDAVFVLVADAATLRQRLLHRTGNDYGKHPAELAATLNTHIARQAELLSAPHAVAIDATRPLEQWQTTSSRASRPGRAREGTRAARQAAELPRHTRVKTLIKCVADVQCRCGVVPEGRWFHRRCGSDWRVGRVAVGVAGSHGDAAFAGKADLAAYKNWRTPLLDRFSAGGTGRPGQGPEHFVSTGRTLGAGTR
jgi:hypothetical protein